MRSSFYERHNKRVNGIVPNQTLKFNKPKKQKKILYKDVFEDEEMNPYLYNFVSPKTKKKKSKTEENLAKLEGDSQTDEME